MSVVNQSQSEQHNNPPNDPRASFDRQQKEITRASASAMLQQQNNQHNGDMRTFMWSQNQQTFRMNNMVCLQSCSIALFCFICRQRRIIITLRTLIIMHHHQIHVSHVVVRATIREVTRMVVTNGQSNARVVGFMHFFCTRLCGHHLIALLLFLW
jgi:hypothetical protein